VKAKANALSRELAKTQKVDEESNSVIWKPCKKRRKIHVLWDYLSHEIDVDKELDANFSFAQIHLISHVVKQIR